MIGQRYDALRAEVRELCADALTASGHLAALIPAE